MRWRHAWLLALISTSQAATLADVVARLDTDAEAGKPLVAHVVVALCDNESQGIVPVPARLGDGDSPQSNLYWGAMYGVRGWFLPSRDELAAMYRNLMAKGLGDFRAGSTPDNFTYWALTQNTTDMAAHIDFPDLGRLHGDDKDFPRRVRAIRAF